MNTIVVVAAVHAGVIVIALLVGYLTYGRERLRGVPESEGRPDDLTPAEVAALDAQGAVTSRAWIATIVELMSRDVIVGGMVAGVHEDSPDYVGFGLQRVDDSRAMRPHERAVARAVAGAVMEGPVARIDLASAMRRRGDAAAQDGREFVISLRRRMHDRRLIIVDGPAFAWSVVAAATVAAAAVLLVVEAFTTAPPETTRDIGIGLAAGTVVGAIAAFVVATWKRLWVGRSDAGGRSAAQWRAYAANLETPELAEPGGDVVDGVFTADLAYAVALGVAPEVEERWMGSVPPGIRRVEPVAVTPV